ncbi:hypothetical protein M2145_000164 [Lachnospiraceae bacterium PF1-21]
MRMRKKIKSTILSIMLIIAMMAPTLVVEASTVSPPGKNGIQIIWSRSEDATTQTFTVKNNSGEAVECDFSDEEGMYQKVPVEAGGSKILSMAFDVYNYGYVEVYSTESGELLHSMTTPSTHEIYVDYVDEDGNLLKIANQKEDGLVYNSVYEGFTFNFTVPIDTFVDTDGTVFKLATNQDKVIPIYYGQQVYEVNFELYKYPDEWANVSLVNESNVDLKYGNWVTSKKIEDGGSQTWNVPKTLDFNDGRVYKLDESQFDELQQYKNITVVAGDNDYAVTINYYTGDSSAPLYDLDIYYDLDVTQVKGDYSVTIDYVDEDGKLISRQFENSNTEQTELQDFNLYTYVKRITNSGDNQVVTYYTPEKTKIEGHDPQSITQYYQIKCTKFDEQKSHDWQVIAVDMNGNTLKKYDAQTIQPDGEAYHTVERSIMKDGKEFIVDGNVPDELRGVYNQDRVTKIKYREVGVDFEKEYDVKVQFMNVTDWNLLDIEKTVQAKYEDGGVQIQTLSTMVVDNKEYVRLNGQEDVIDHQWDSNQRVHTIYYRDINDDTNADTYVTREEHYDVVIDEDGTETLVETPSTILVNDETGQEIMLDEQGVPLAENIGDKNVPKSKASSKEDDDKETVASAQPNWPVMISLAALALALIIGAAFFVAKKKKKVNDVEENDQN